MNWQMVHGWWFILDHRLLQFRWQGHLFRITDAMVFLFPIWKCQEIACPAWAQEEDYLISWPPWEHVWKLCLVSSTYEVIKIRKYGKFKCFKKSHSLYNFGQFFMLKAISLFWNKLITLIYKSTWLCTMLGETYIRAAARSSFFVCKFRVMFTHHYSIPHSCWLGH